MKNTFFIFGIFILCWSFIANPVKSQDSESIARKSKPASIERPSNNPPTVGDSKRSNYLLIRSRVQNHNRNTNFENTDTLNFPLAGTRALYTADDGGYITGNNQFGDLAKANYFAINSSVSLTGILFDFAVAVGGNPSIEIVIWDNSGVNNSPGTIIASGSVDLDIIKNDIANQLMTYVSFSPPVLLSTSFYAGIVLPTSEGDTLAVFSNTDGDTSPGTAWEKWNDGSWLPISSNDTWSRDIALSIFPIIVGSSQIETDTLNYPLAGEYGVYVTDGNGFVTGNNETGDLAKANYFSNNQSLFITGVLMEFAYATGGNPNIEIALWDNSGSNGSPGTKIGSQNVTLNTIKSHIDNQQMTYVAFSPPVNVASSFYAGFMLPTITGDTLVVWSNLDGDTYPSIAWELWNNNEWHSFTGMNTWNLNIALAIFPIVQSTLGMEDKGIEEAINVFPNPSQGVYYLASELFRNESVKLSIYKIDGTLIQAKDQRNGEVLSIDLSTEPAGIYFVKLEMGSKIIIEKLVKQ